MKVQAKLTLEHVTWDEPIVHWLSLEGPSLASVVKRFKLNGRHLCDLKNTREASWEDTRGVYHHLSIQELV